jgi:uncharacterized damage-inducible protein DinB
MTPEQASGFLKIYSTLLQRESQTTKQVLGAVPADRADYRPDAISKSAMDLVTHIATSEHWFVEAVLTGAFTPGPRIPDAAKTPAEIAAWYGDYSAKNLEALAKATPEQLLKIVNFRGMFEQPAMLFLTMGLHHSIHHRGQLTSYLRSMGAKVPAIYGESYDSAEAKKASGAA